MHFIHPTLAWGFALVAAPVVIHLLNLLRQRRVAWAAMDFLLQSHRKRRHWIWLQQLILLLLRMTAVALAVAMLARMVTEERWSEWLQPQKLHYFLVVDDSYSMSDRSGAVTALDRGVAGISSLVERLLQQPHAQQYTLIRLSHAASHATRTDQRDDTKVPLSATEFLARSFESIDDEVWQQAWSQMISTETAARPEAAFDTLLQLIRQRPDEHPVAMVFSDFRKDQWADNAQVKRVLSELTSLGVDIEFIQTVDQQHPNLTITALAQQTPRAAANVPVVFSIEVTNHGTEVVDDIPIHLRTKSFSSAQDTRGQVQDLPDLAIDQLAPGQTAEVRAQVVFASAGQHAVEAALDPDAIETDNHRWAIVDTVDVLPTLIVTDAESIVDGFYLQSVFQPDPAIQTGVRPVVESVNYLRQASLEQLADFATLYLLDLPALDPIVYQKLTSYVEQGGGLACFAGPTSDTPFWNQGREATSEENSGPLFDFTARRVAQLAVDRREGEFDFQPNHSIFQVLQGDRNPWLPAIRIERHIEVAWPDEQQANTPWTVAAKLRSGTPLALVRAAGRGRVAAVMTTLGPRWNNWAKQPSFVVFALRLQEYLTIPDRQTRDRPLAQQWHWTKLPHDVRDRFTLWYPGADPFGEGLTTTGSIRKDDESAYIPSESMLLDPYGTSGRGVYSLQFVDASGGLEVERFAVNVDPTEGDLRFLTAAELIASYPDATLEVRATDDLLAGVAGNETTDWSHLLFTPLALVLLCEQFLAYWLSYHPRGAN